MSIGSQPRKSKSNLKKCTRTTCIPSENDKTKFLNNQFKAARGIAHIRYPLHIAIGIISRNGGTTMSKFIMSRALGSR